MAKIITTIKKIATLGKRELRYTEMDGEKKYDIRAWNGDKYEEGVRFSQTELDQLYDGIKKNDTAFQIGSKICVIENNNYALSVLFNGRTYVRPFATKDEMAKLIKILDVAKNNLLDYDENVTSIGKEAVKKALTTKSNKKSTSTPVKAKEEPKKVYANAYEKFADQFKEYRENQPENRRKGYELTHNIILEHIKAVCETSDEYNKNGMQEWKNTENMMKYCQDKAFENAEVAMNASKDEGIEMMCQWIDEYIGDTSDKPKPKENKKKG